MEEWLAKAYRRIAATVNHLALDRVDIQFSTGVLGRTAANPTIRSCTNLKKVARYLVGHPRVVYRYDECKADGATRLIAHSDSDSVGCRNSRHSVSVGLIVMAGGLVKSWSNR